MKKKIVEVRLRKGQIVKCPNNMVLVTDTKGDTKEAGYPCFSGVVIYANENIEQDTVWPVGMYSRTWTRDAFTHTKIRMNDIMKILVK